ncbi:unnamed protein product [Paramecium pentaurelia]|uniref:RING-type domain-containing protein n=1 Tax=Paramecium pentaurelia TaxID=43138 RepID=A0A8S1V8S1_9CILI|nr:unnamed protein product [Paramecium pentaurelia]
MKLAIYEVGLFPQNMKTQFQELQAFSQWQYLGKNLISTVFIALLDFFIATNKSQAMEQLAKPKSSYQNGQNLMISQLIYNLRMGKINTKEFFTQLKNFDSSNDKGGQLLEEFCQLQGLKRSSNNPKLMIESIANFFSITIIFIRQFSIGNTSKSRVFILQQIDGYYLIKQSSTVIQYINQRQQICKLCQMRCDDYFITPVCFHISCYKCLNEKIRKANQQLVLSCNNYCMQKILVKDIQYYQIKELNIQEKKFQQEQSINLSKSQQFTNDNQKSNSFQNVVENNNQKINQIYYNNLIDSKQQQRCNSCQQSNINQIFINSLCNHKFCIDCFKKRIITQNQRCPIKDCYKAIDASLFQQRIQLENEIQKNQKSFQTINLQSFKCSKCMSEYNISSLYKDKGCMHFICFTCIELQVQKSIQNKLNYQIVKCPLCNNIYGRDFEKYYDQQQLLLVEQRIKYDEQFKKEDQERELKEKEQQQTFQQQKQEQQQLLESSSYKKVEKYSYEINDTQKQQSQILTQYDQQNNSQSNKNLLDSTTQSNKFEEGLKQNEQGECTMCYTQFSEFNLRQEIDCQYHQIGVCCMINFKRCPQCESKNVNSKIIRAKPKLILQTFIQNVEFISQSSIYNSSTKQYNYGNADDYSRLNSRGNVIQNQNKPQQRNSTMDTNIFRSQAQQNNVVSVYGAGYKR